MIPLGLLSLAYAAGLAGCGGDAKSKPLADQQGTSAAPVEVASVTTGALEPTYAATASLEAVREAVIRAEMPGEILDILVEEGDRVAAGQVLARLDDARVRLELKQVATVADRLAHEAARSEKLLERQMISREAYDRARYERDTQDAAVAIARHSLSQGVIRAPYAGVVTRRHVKEGQWLALQQPAFEIADFTELQARLAVPEKQAMALQPGQPARFRADAFAGREFTGEVQRTSPVVDRASGTVGVTLALANADLALRPGMFVRVEVSFDPIEAATLVPKAAVIADAQHNRVFVVIENDVVDERSVVLGYEIGSLVQVLSGLEAGARVVTTGHSALKDGDKVAVVNAPAAARAIASTSP